MQPERVAVVLKMSVVVALVISYSVSADTVPVCPSGPTNEPTNEPTNNQTTTAYPAFAESGKPPAVAIWRELETLAATCHVALNRSAALAVSLAGSFSFAGTIDELAARVGAVSELTGLSYWSVSDKKWRTLVTRSYAVVSGDSQEARTDFKATEVLGDKTLYFAQKDSRSWGLNIYSIHAIESSPDHLIVKTANTSPVRFGPIKVFDIDDLQTVQFFTRVDNTLWHYYSLAVIVESRLAAREKSLINRQAALYRFIAGEKPDKEPPLAP